MENRVEKRLLELQERLRDETLDAFLLTDPDSIYYFTSYWGYLGMEFGRPTMLVVPASGVPTLITPAMEEEMASAMTWVQDIRTWRDGADSEWVGHLRDLLARHDGTRLAIERFQIHPRVLDAIHSELFCSVIRDGSGLLADMRMIKSPEDIATMRQAGMVAVSMVQAGIEAIDVGVPEYEVALAVLAGGTRKAAELLSGDAAERLTSPTLHFLQILKSGAETSMMHRRSTLRPIERGDPVFMCCCGIASFRHVKLGFDRSVFVREASDEHLRWAETARCTQAAALEAIRPGVPAEEVHFAAMEVLRSAGITPAGRTGRAVGYSYLEKPELKEGDRTLLEPGMALAVDGNVTIKGRFACQFGDSVVVTENGFEFLTDYPREVRII